MNIKILRTMLTCFIALVWFINGLFCKVLNFAPRHEQIVSRILGEDIAFLATKAIGVSEILMVLWIFSKIQSRWCAITQIGVITLMNIIEFIIVPDLLLFGRINIFVAFCFNLVIFSNEFLLDKT